MLKGLRRVKESGGWVSLPTSPPSPKHVSGGVWGVPMLLSEKSPPSPGAVAGHGSASRSATPSPGGPAECRKGSVTCTHWEADRPPSHTRVNECLVRSAHLAKDVAPGRGPKQGNKDD